MTAYLPVVLSVLAVVALLFATATDRRRQLAAVAGNINRWRGGHGRARWSASRIVFWLVLLFALSYIWTYQRVQDAIAAQLTADGINEVTVGSLIIPYSAFFRNTYVADAGFSYSKKRTRTTVAIGGRPWSGFSARLDEAALAAVSKVTEQKFVFSYLTDVKILRPAIHRHMDQLVRGEQIDKYEIETFDNRGPYIIVALSEQNRSRDAKALADSIAQGLHTNLTVANQLKVNQVVVKVVEPQPYLTAGAITVIARGTAGSY